MRQSRKTIYETIEAIAAQVKALCLQGQFGRATKSLSSEGVAPDQTETFGELKTLYLLEDEPRLHFQIYSSIAQQFDEPTVFSQIEAFLNFCAAGSFKMYSEHLLHAVNCIVPNQSKQANTCITKLANLSSRGQLSVSVAPDFCNASLIAWKKLKEVCVL